MIHYHVAIGIVRASEENEINSQLAFNRVL